MLKIHKTTSKKLLLISITSICITFGLLGFYYLTYIPELSHAETVTYDPIHRYHPNISDITYMQDMTEEVCQNSYENDTKQLIDKRDGKTYWVAKLKDGNCWMTQNLDLDLYVNGAGRKLTAADSDVPSDWTSTTGASGLWFTSGSDYNIVKYYDPGDYAYTQPTTRLSSGCGLLNSDNCKNAGWALINGASTDKTSNEMTHYLAGNYYTFNAATAGKGATITANGNSVENNSICPKGWQLPIDSDDKSYNTLLTSYGTNSELLYGTQDIRLTPLYFVYGGYVDTGSLNAAGSYGYDWSSTAANASRAYNLTFRASVSSSDYNYRYYGFPVRCVARGEAVVRPVPLVDNVTININPQISLDVADEVVVEKSETNPSTADLSVKVSSNQPYAVNINVKEHAELTSENGDKIPSNGGVLTAAENNWGIMKPGDTTYTKITTSPELFYQATSAEVKDILFKVGISTAPDLANGTYATDIVITATQN